MVFRILTLAASLMSLAAQIALLIALRRTRRAALTPDQVRVIVYAELAAAARAKAARRQARYDKERRTRASYVAPLKADHDAEPSA